MGEGMSEIAVCEDFRTANICKTSNLETEAKNSIDIKPIPYFKKKEKKEKEEIACNHKEFSFPLSISEKEKKEKKKEKQPTPTRHPIPLPDGVEYLFEDNRTSAKINGKTTLLANAVLKIQEYIQRDDGFEVKHSMSIDGRMWDGETLPLIEIPKTQFMGMNWVFEKWNHSPVIYAGFGTKEHFRTAIQARSGRPATRIIYEHTGWRNFGGEWRYLHAGGALAAHGPVEGLEVDPSGVLNEFALPAPPQGQALHAAIRASLAILDVTRDEISVPLWLACYRAPMGGAHFSLHLYGKTGRGKSTIQALAQSHWGTTWTYEHLPASWVDTKPSLEILTSKAKDAVLCIDDFAPDGTRRDREEIKAKVSHIFRQAGNGGGRQKALDGRTLDQSRDPQCLTISSGEDIPDIPSIQARALLLECADDFLDMAHTTTLQEYAGQGLFAQAMAAYVQWLAPQFGDMAPRLARRLKEVRPMFEASHRKSVDAAAQLFMSGEHFLRFAQDVGCIDADEASRIENRLRNALCNVCDTQSETQRDSNPVQRFLEIMPTLFMTGRFHLEGTKKKQPASAENLGWKRIEDESSLLKDQGTLIGWEDEETGWLYLNPHAFYSSLQDFSYKDGAGIALSRIQLGKQLDSAGLLVQRDGKKKTYPAPGRGNQQQCWVIHRHSFGIGEASPMETSKTKAS